MGLKGLHQRNSRRLKRKNNDLCHVMSISGHVFLHTLFLHCRRLSSRACDQGKLIGYNEARCNCIQLPYCSVVHETSCSSIFISIFTPILFRVPFRRNISTNQTVAIPAICDYCDFTIAPSMTSLLGTGVTKCLKLPWQRWQRCIATIFVLDQVTKTFKRFRQALPIALFLSYFFHVLYH